MAEPRASYRIDYEAPDVVDLMRQIRTRVGAEGELEPLIPDAGSDVRSRVRDYLELDDQRPYALQDELGMGGGWNVTPEDLRASHPGAAGSVIGALRPLLRPATKLFANLELPLYKQFKVNLGTAAALRDLLDAEAALRRRVADLERRIERLESPPAGNDDRTPDR